MSFCGSLISSYVLKKIQYIVVKEAKSNSNFFKKIVDEGHFYFNVDDYYSGKGEIHIDLTAEKIIKSINAVIKDNHEVTEVYISPLIFCTPTKLIEKCLTSDMITNANGDGWSLAIEEYQRYENAIALFEKICPILNGRYSWSSSKTIKREIGNINRLLDGDYGTINHLYMKGDTPFLEQIPYYRSYDTSITEKVTDIILKHFGNWSIKEVFFIKGEDKPFNRVIARKNPDGELTLTIY